MAAAGVALTVTMPDGSLRAQTLSSIEPGATQTTMFEYQLPTVERRLPGESFDDYRARYGAWNLAHPGAAAALAWGAAAAGATAESTVHVPDMVVWFPGESYGGLPGQVLAQPMDLWNWSSVDAHDVSLSLTVDATGETAMALPFDVVPGYQRREVALTLPPLLPRQAAETDAAYESRLYGRAENPLLGVTARTNWYDGNGTSFGEEESLGQIYEQVPALTVAWTNGRDDVPPGGQASYATVIANWSPGEAVGARLLATFPDGSSADLPLASPWPQGTVLETPSYGWTVPVAPLRAPAESSADYLARLLALSDRVLTTQLALTWEDALGNQYGPINRTATSREKVPVLVPTVSEPGTALLPGQTAAVSVSAQNTGGEWGWGDLSAGDSHWTPWVAPGGTESGLLNVAAPAFPHKALAESDGEYLARLREAVRVVNVPTSFSWTDRWSTPYGTLEGTVALTEVLPMVVPSLDAVADTATNEVTYTVRLENQGHAIATDVTATLTLPDGSTNEIAMSAALGAGEHAVAQVVFAASGAEPLTARVAVVWRDALLCGYGPLSAGATLGGNAAPVVDAGPDQVVSLPPVPQAPPLAFAPLGASIAGARAAGFHAPTGGVLVSVHAPSGEPGNLELVAVDGSRTPFSALHGLTGRVEFAVAPDDAGATSIGGFAAGSVFLAAEGTPGTLARLSADGQSFQAAWVTLPGETGVVRGGIAFDRSGTFGGDLLVATSSGAVWRVNATGAAVRLAQVPRALAGLVALPADAGRYGPLASKLLASVRSQLTGVAGTTGPASETLFAIDASGSSTPVDLGIRQAAGLHLVPPWSAVVGVDPAQGLLLGAPAEQVSPIAGDLLVAGEASGSLWRVRWTGSAFQVNRIADQASWGGLAFLPWSTPVLGNATAHLAGSATDDGLPNPPGQLALGWSADSATGAVTFASPASALSDVSLGAAGTYVLRLTASDSLASTSAATHVTVLPRNRAPAVNAGPDLVAAPGAAVALNGSATDDGLPLGSWLSFAWTVVSGPGPVTFTAASQPVTSATFTAPGEYVLELAATDGLLTGTSRMRVTQLPVLTLAIAAPTTAAPGDVLDYAITVTNASQADAVATLFVLLPDGTGEAVGLNGTLAPGASVVAHVGYALPAHQPAGSVQATAVLTWTDAAGSVYGPLQATSSTSVAESRPVLALTLDVPSVALPGASLNAFLVVTNSGGVPFTTASGLVALPDGSSVPWSVGDLAAGASATVPLAFLVPPLVPRGATETDPVYLARLQALDERTLPWTANGTALAGANGGPLVLASAATVELVPVVVLTVDAPAQLHLFELGVAHVVATNFGHAPAMDVSRATLDYGGQLQWLPPETLLPGQAVAHDIPIWGPLDPECGSHSCGLEANVQLATSFDGQPVEFPASVEWADSRGGLYGPLSVPTHTIDAEPVLSFDVSMPQPIHPGETVTVGVASQNSGHAQAQAPRLWMGTPLVPGGEYLETWPALDSGHGNTASLTLSVPPVLPRDASQSSEEYGYRLQDLLYGFAFSLTWADPAANEFALWRSVDQPIQVAVLSADYASVGLLPGEQAAAAMVIRNNGTADAQNVELTTAGGPVLPGPVIIAGNGAMEVAYLPQVAAPLAPRGPGETNAGYLARLYAAQAQLGVVIPYDLRWSDAVANAYGPVDAILERHLVLPILDHPFPFTVGAGANPFWTPGSQVTASDSVSNRGSDEALAAVDQITVDGSSVATIAFPSPLVAASIPSSASASWTVPLLEAKGATEGDAAYLARLAAADGRSQAVVASRRWLDRIGNVYGPIVESLVATLQVPRVLSTSVNASAPPGSTARIGVQLNSPSSVAPRATRVSRVLPTGDTVLLTTLSGGLGAATIDWPIPPIEPRGALESEAGYRARLKASSGGTTAVPFTVAWSGEGAAEYGPIATAATATTLLGVIEESPPTELAFLPGEQRSVSISLTNSGNAQLLAPQLLLDQTTSFALPALVAAASGSIAVNLSAPNVAPKGASETDADYLRRIDTMRAEWPYELTWSGVGPTRGTIQARVDVPVLHLTLDGPKRGALGERLAYVARVSNSGLVSGQATLTFDLPNGSAQTLTFPVAAGQEAGKEFTWTAAVQPSTPAYARLSWVDAMGNAYGPLLAQVRTNFAPAVDAGREVFGQVDQPATLLGSVADDGLPAGGTLTSRWRVLDGPAGLVFANAGQPTSQVTAHAPGTWTLELAAFDGELGSTSRTTLTVRGSGNLPPAVDAGPSQVLTLAHGSVSASGPIPPVTLQLAVSGLSSAIGVADAPLSGGLLLSVNYPGGSPEVFRVLRADGSSTPFSSAAGWYDEVYMDAAPDDGGGLSRGGFVAGDIFAGTGSSGAIARLSASGALLDNPWFVLPGEGTLRGGFRVDRAGVFGGDLIVVSTNCGLWRISAAKVAQKLAQLPATTCEALEVIPNDPRYGPWAGTAIVLSEGSGGAYAVNPAGQVSYWPLGIPAPEKVRIVPPAANLYTVTLGSLYFVSADALTPLVGDLVVSSENFGGALTRIHWDGTQFQTSVLTSGGGIGSLEGMDFSGAGIGAAPPGRAVVVALHGTASDDGLPDPPGVLSTSWSMVSGPRPTLFAAPLSVATEATLTAPGTYVFRLTASDGEFTSTADTQVVLQPGNQPPEVSAGTEQVLSFPQLVTLQGQVNDDGLPAFGQLVAQWTREYGPGSVTFADATSAQTTATFDAPGVHLLRLSASDGEFTASKSVLVTLVAPNEAPVVSVSAEDPVVELPGVLRFDGTATDDGQPNPPGVLGYSWALVSGPGPLSFGYAHGTSAVVSPQVPGTYVVEFSAADGEKVGRARTSVTVLAHNLAPIVETGADLLLAAPGTAFLAGRVRDDGLPAGAALTATWTQEAGPAVATFEDPHASQTLASFPAQGVYGLRLTASDGPLSSSAQVQVTVLGASGGATNAPPMVSLQTNLVVRLPGTATLIGGALDDGLPAGSTLSLSWSVVAASVAAPQVTFQSPGSPVTAATFGEPGTYTLRLTASDGQLAASASIDVLVLSADAPNQPPRVSAGPDRAVSVTSPLQLLGSALDDGLPAGSTLSLQWSLVSGPAGVSFASPHSAATAATFDDSGQYLLRLTASDGLLSAASDVRVTVLPPNLAPRVTAGAGQVVVYPAAAALSGNASDDGQPAGSVLQVTWTVVSGPGAVTFADAHAPQTSAVFGSPGSYVLRLTATDGFATAWSDVDIAVIGTGDPAASNLAPDVSAGTDATLRWPMASLQLHGYASDDGLPNPPAHLALAWSLAQASGQAGTPGVTFSDPAVLSPLATFASPGAYTLRFSAYDGALANSATVRVIVLSSAAGNQPPTISVPAPSTVGLGSAVLLAGSVSDDGLPSDGMLSIAWSQLSGPGVATFTAPNQASTSATLPWPGLYTLRLTASDGELTRTADTQVLVLPPSGSLPVAQLTAPADGDRVTAPVAVTGRVSEGVWTVEVARGGDEAPGEWRTLARGQGSAQGALASLDPTQLLNGVYTLRLSAETSAGLAQDSLGVVVDKGMKVGNFAVAFSDLIVQAPGLPIQLVRSYDSRDERRGDFGRGWQLSLADVRVEKTVMLGKFWEETKEGYFALPSYCLRPTKANQVTVTFPTGKVYRFEARTTPECQRLASIDSSDFTFVALPGTNGALAIDFASPTVFTAIREGLPGPVTLVDSDGSVFNPIAFRLTTEDGTTYHLKQCFGVERIEDANGNTLTITREGVQASNGSGVTFARDVDGRIVSITDANGKALRYDYDAAGNLAVFTDRDGNRTTYAYDALGRMTTITDPRGQQVLANTWGADGRLAATADASGRSVTSEHDVVGRREVVHDRLGNKRVFEYDEDGNVVREVDALGRVTTRGYDERDNKLFETNALGETTSWTYDLRDNKMSETDALGNTTRFTYGPLRDLLTTADPLGHVTTNERLEVAVCGQAMPSGNLLATVDALGNRTRYTYVNCTGQVQTTTDARGGVTTYAYDQAGWVQSTTDALGHTTSYSYDDNGNQLSETRTRVVDGVTETLVTTYAYDASGRRTQVTYPDGSTTHTIYNALGKVSESTDQLGRATRYAYDEQGRLTTTTYPDGTATGTAYDASGRRASSTDREGRTTSYEYDAVGRLTKTTFADGSFRTSTYDAVGRVQSSVDELGHATSYEYDAAGRRTKVTDALGNATAFAYDAAGNQLAVTDALGHTVTSTYDAANRVVRTTYPDGTHDDTEYDAAGNRSAKVDQAGVRTQYGYDLLGRLTSVTDALAQVTSYGYDELGNRLSQTDANGHTTSFAYDALGRRRSRTLPLGETERFTYFADGQLQTRTDFNGRTTTFAYDSSGRLTTRTPDAHFLAAGEPVVSWTYWPSGRRHTMSDATGVTSYVYDARDRLVSKATPEGTLSYTYDAAGNRTTVRSDSGAYAVDYGYDALNRLSTVTDRHPDALTATGNVGQVTAYHYDLAGRLHDNVYPNGVATTWSYDDLGRITNITTARGATALASYTYGLGPTGNRHSVAELNGRSVTWDYDGLYRLTTETIAGAASANGVIGYAYDPVGNRLSRTSTVPGIAAQAFTYDADDRLNSDAWDANGNTLASATSTYGYDSENRLVSLNASEAGYLYDGDGQLVRRTVGGVATTYLVDELTPAGYTQIAEERVGGVVAKSYVFGPQRVSMRGAEGVHWYLYDAHSGVRALVEATGIVTDTYEYDAFGSTRARTGTTENAFTYRGEQVDAKLGLQYLRARWMDPRRGRFSTRDPMIESGEGSYVFAGGDPTNRLDPRGLFSLEDVALNAEMSVWRLLGAVAGSAKSACSDGLVFDPVLLPVPQCARKVHFDEMAAFTTGLTYSGVRWIPWINQVEVHTRIVLLSEGDYPLFRRRYPPEKYPGCASAAAHGPVVIARRESCRGKEDELLGTVVHELTHVLQFYRDLQANLEFADAATGLIGSDIRYEDRPWEREAFRVESRSGFGRDLGGYGYDDWGFGPIDMFPLSSAPGRNP